MGHIWWVLADGARKPIHVAEVLGSTREADARLIAAAPELYGLLELAITLMPLGTKKRARLAL
jgi:hypothetical protein